MSKIIIWGTGGRTEYYISQGYFNRNEIVAFADNNVNIFEYRGYKVIHPDEIANQLKTADYLVICSKAYLEIVKQCIIMKLDWNKIVLTDNNGDLLCQDAFERLKKVSVDLYENLSFCKYIRTKRNEYDLVDKQLRMGKGKYVNEQYIDEYFRFRTFEFVAYEIKRRNVCGAVAEFGVFNGTFAALINDVFSDRKVYLFDTFEGFDEEEAKREIEKGNCDVAFINAHKKSDEKIVKRVLPYPEKAVICKGFFPNSIPEEAYKEQFAFVSIDVDFEESTYRGLEFFWPRLCDGGTIFIHDYHTSRLDGVGEAVRRFERDTGMDFKCVPIADRAGTLIVIK